MPDPVVHFEILSKTPAELHKFYSDAFGWHIDTDNPIGYGVVDTRSGDGINGGIGEAQQGPNMTTFYVAVSSHEDTLATAERLGGRTILPPTDVMEGLRIALVADHEGNTIGLVNQAPPDQPFGPSAGDGDPVAWFEIVGSGGKKLRDFYNTVFGWEFEVDEEHDYGQMHAAAGISGGVGASQSGPSVMWYVKVADASTALDKIASLGGKTLMEPVEMGTIRFAHFADPEGNRIGVYDERS